MLVGIDPGKNGGVALLGRYGTWLGGMRMPTLKHGKRDVVDTVKLEQWVRETQGQMREDVDFVIEQVNAMPGQGVSSMFNFGRHTGAVEGWALSHGRPVNWVTPRVWKGHFNLQKQKAAALDRARLEFGDAPIWNVKANDGIAEAALLALYWLRKGAQ